MRMRFAIFSPLPSRRWRQFRDFAVAVKTLVFIPLLGKSKPFVNKKGKFRLQIQVVQIILSESFWKFPKRWIRCIPLFPFQPNWPEKSCTISKFPLDLVHFHLFPRLSTPQMQLPFWFVIVFFFRTNDKRHGIPSVRGAPWRHNARNTTFTRVTSNIVFFVFRIP